MFNQRVTPTTDSASYWGRHVRHAKSGQCPTAVPIPIRIKNMKHLNLCKGLLLVSTILSLAASVFAAKPPPNIVMIISDDQGWTDYGFMGHKEIRTPHIDRLAAQSLT